MSESDSSIPQEAVDEIKQTLVRLSEKYGLDSMICLMSRTVNDASSIRWSGVGNVYARVAMCDRYIRYDSARDNCMDTDEYEGEQDQGEDSFTG